MARNSTIKFLRTTRSNLTTQASASALFAGEPYFVTDEGRISIANAVNTVLDMATKTEVDSKQATLVSGTSIKTVGGVSLLGSGDAGTLGLAYGGSGQITAPAALNTFFGYTTTATAAGTTTLTVSSSNVQFFTGSTTQTVTLPVTSTLSLGWTYIIVNNSSGTVTLNSSGANAVFTIAAGQTCHAVCILTSGTSAASWSARYAGFAATANFPTLNQNTTGSAATLTTGRTIGMTGDVTWTSASFNGSGNVTGTSTISSDAVTNTQLANMATTTVKGRAVGAGTGDPQDLTPLQVKDIVEGYTTTATAAGTTTLSVSSTAIQFFTGSTTQTITLPVTSTLALGWSYKITNNSSGALTVNSSGSNLVATIAAGQTWLIACILTSGTSAASWSANMTGFGAVANFPTFNQNTTGSAATLTTPRSIYGNSFNGSADLGQAIAATYGGHGQTTLQAGLAALLGFTTTATTAGTTTLTNTSTFNQIFTGTTTQTITLPVTSTLATGWTFKITNNSTGNLTINSSGSNLVATILPGMSFDVVCILASGTSAASWNSFASGGADPDGVALVATGTIATGDKVSLRTDGTVEVTTGTITPVLGTKQAMNSVAVNNMAACFDSADNVVVVAYFTSDGNSNAACVVGTVSGTSISFGTPVSLAQYYFGNIAIAYVGSSKVAVSGIHVGGGYWSAIVGTVSGTSISFGTRVQINNLYANPGYVVSISHNFTDSVTMFASYDSGNTCVKLVAGTLSGTTYTFGTATYTPNLGAGSDSACHCSHDSASNKWLVVSAKQGKCFLATTSGTTITTSASTTFDGSSPSIYYIWTVPIGGSKSVIVWRDSAGAGKAVVADLSGSTVSLGSSVTFHSGTVDGPTVNWDTSGSKGIFTYSDYTNSGYFTAKTFTVSGSTITLGAAYVIRSTNTSGINSSVFEANAVKIVGVFRDSGSSSYGHGIVTSTATTISTNADKFIGFAKAGCATGQTVRVNVTWMIDGNRSGLTARTNYWIDYDGSFSTADTGYKRAGYALTATQIQVGVAGA